MSGKPKDGRRYTNGEAAKVLGIDARTVKRWRAKGWIVNRSDGTLDRMATLARANANKDPTLGGRQDRGVIGTAPQRAHDGFDAALGDSAKLLKARTLRETLAAKALRLEIEEREGKLVDREAAERVYVSAITDLKTRIEAIPDRVASRLVGLEARAIRDVLRDEIETALRTVSEVPFIGTEIDGGL
jgi:phage terminase Nu1 subunit (DNA packaging protein)